jgi:REP element-mobilizing transposase RayT
MRAHDDGRTPDRSKKRIGKSKPGWKTEYGEQHRFEHWYVDNQVYFITSRVRGRYAAFANEEAKAIFWDRFEHYTEQYGFTPFVTSLLPNHYHTLGYLYCGANLRPMMQRLHGSVAKLVNDLLEARAEERITPFWWDHGQQGYFDGCIRDEQQCRRAYRYTLEQSMRHRIARHWRHYPHTRVAIDVERAVTRALEKRAFLTGVPYKRYEKQNAPRDH